MAHSSGLGPCFQIQDMLTLCIPLYRYHYLGKRKPMKSTHQSCTMPDFIHHKTALTSPVRGTAYSARGPAPEAGGFPARMVASTIAFGSWCLEPPFSSRSRHRQPKILTAAFLDPCRPTPHSRGRAQYSVHDVFVDTHRSPAPFDQRPDDQIPNPQ